MIGSRKQLVVYWVLLAGLSGVSLRAQQWQQVGSWPHMLQNIIGTQVILKE